MGLGSGLGLGFGSALRPVTWLAAATALGTGVSRSRPSSLVTRAIRSAIVRGLPPSTAAAAAGAAGAAGVGAAGANPNPVKLGFVRPGDLGGGEGAPWRELQAASSSSEISEREISSFGDCGGGCGDWGDAAAATAAGLGVQSGASCLASQAALAAASDATGAAGAMGAMGGAGGAGAAGAAGTVYCGPTLVGAAGAAFCGEGRLAGCVPCRSTRRSEAIDGRAGSGSGAAAPALREPARLTTGGQYVALLEGCAWLGVGVGLG